LKVLGESVGEIRGNPTAVPVILHTLIDNALKYSKRDSEVRIQFHETDTYIDFSVSSFGPKIAEDERERIFDLFYRGRSARDQEEEGAGFGLYLAQFIAMTIGTRIYASQSSDQNRLGYWTTFSVRFRRDR
jgi:K+-sensing histidine kinase KdpD